MDLNERILESAIMKELVRNQIPVTVSLTNGTEYQGAISRYDLLVIVLVAEGVQKIIYKHSIASITPHSTLTCAQPKNPRT